MLTKLRLLLGKIPKSPPPLTALFDPALFCEYFRMLQGDVNFYFISLSIGESFLGRAALLIVWARLRVF